MWLRAAAPAWGPITSCPAQWNRPSACVGFYHGLSGRGGTLCTLVLALFAILALGGCSSAPPPQPAAGTAYAGPATLNLRSELIAKSPVVATTRHGDRLEVLETRRRFVKVRTAAGVEGWTDVNLLLSEQQMSDLRRLAASAAKLPSQGTATVYEALNVHTEPYRQSASFFQIPDGGSVEVIGHRVTPHAAPPPPPKAVTVHRAGAPKKTKSKGQVSPLGPPPAPPPPPANWLELSRPHNASASTSAGASASAAAAARAATALPPPPEDDWFLVRTRNGDTGWALSRMLSMSIPDEVAQYAEGHRVTAYLALGDVPEGGKVENVKNDTKNNWLWTTASAGLRPYDFDSFRVFVWSSKRHHYETAYIDRNVKGYYPVETVSLAGQDEKAFSVVLEDKDGKLYKRIYGFSGYHVRMISKTPYEQPPPLPEVRAPGGFEAEPAPPPSASSSWSDKFHDWRKKWLGW
jgi:Bacterial SH3 domain